MFDDLRDEVGAVSPRDFVRLFELAAGKEPANQALRPFTLLAVREREWRNSSYALITL